VRFSKSIGEHVVRRRSNKIDETIFDVLTDNVKLDGDMLRSSPGDRVKRKIYGPFVITMQWDWIFDSVTDLGEKTPIPRGLIGCVCKGHVLSMGRALSYGLLLARGPRDRGIGE
jgi:hypothetical protein